MNKLQIIKELSKKADISKDSAKYIFDMVFESMADTLSDDDRIEIRGLGSFSVKEYNGYTGRNPKTGEKAEIRPKKLPVFRPGKELKEMVDYNQK